MNKSGGSYISFISSSFVSLNNAFGNIWCDSSDNNSISISNPNNIYEDYNKVFNELNDLKEELRKIQKEKEMIKEENNSVLFGDSEREVDI